MIYSKVNNIENILWEKIQAGGEISPFLFCSQNLELLHEQLIRTFSSLRAQFWLDTQSIFMLYDTWETIKIEEVKQFLLHAQTKPRFAFQIFYIESFSRMTPQAQNACLKFLEEPGEGNIVILTNQTESWILETILSRVQKYIIFSKNSISGSQFFYDMISNSRKKRSDELVRYFFGAKLEKQEYVLFLQTLLSYYLEHREMFDSLDELQEDIQGILQNNLQARYIVDKWILRF